MSHNKITFAKEYCLCRRIPYRMKGEQMIIGRDRKEVIYSVYNFTYDELVRVINECAEKCGVEPF